ncbi:hypothetical protein L249_4406 [Ophiocordyceps polyrhachis-furcata BCC 54312]|uniref:Anaphase-promoting complex subunit 4 WD40 domain-containing protein n=1 Tax=Ophiocordyceps polyrhachis-furcata BCC 54312 TaxID=1330021 RepID=A0A367L857_9HYPO|nr:hypothetical protein L249_4406 [Ophiocordyceps polyrhachis-furcata BCC 54312]
MEQDDFDQDVKRPPNVRLVASLTPTADDAPPPPSTKRQDAFFSSALWTGDGTTVVVQSSDNSVSSVVLPADLLEYADRQTRLTRQATTTLPEPSQAVAVAPFFSLADAVTQTFLAGCRDHPLHLYHAFPSQGRDSSAPLATYKLVRAETEQFLTPASIVWPSPGSHFLCGSANRLDYFDLSRPGPDGPVLTLPTIPSKRHISKGGGVGMKGTVSALASGPDCPVAAGTRSRWMGLYDAQRSKDAIVNWGIADAGRDLGLQDMGQGIVQVVWTPCGRYLVINERKSSALLVYDIRGTGRLLGALCGREATTQQRLACDVYQGQDGVEVWAGLQDGCVAVWEGVGRIDGLAQPSWTWAAHQSPVGSTTLHGCGSVIATCSGAWEHAPDGAVEDFGGGGGQQVVATGGVRTLAETSLKIWSMGS